MLKGFRNFLLRGNVIVIAVGLMVALAVSTLIHAFTTYVIDPLISAIEGGQSMGLGVQLGHHGNTKTFLDFGSFISAIIYFIIFMAVLYFLIVVPYKRISARMGTVVFGDPAPTICRPRPASADTAGRTSRRSEPHRFPRLGFAVARWPLADAAGDGECLLGGRNPGLHLPHPADVR